MYPSYCAISIALILLCLWSVSIFHLDGDHGPLSSYVQLTTNNDGVFTIPSADDTSYGTPVGLQSYRIEENMANGSEETMAKLRPAFPLPKADGDGEQFPQWLKHLCPGVVDHFLRFPYFTHHVDDLPIMTSSTAAHSVCSIYLANQIAHSVDAPIYLNAGSHLGAILHGGPIPWDDDVDILLSYDKKDDFLAQCGRVAKEFSFPDISINCTQGNNAIKFFISTPDSTSTPFPWQHPFLDVGLFVANNTHLYEVTPVGKVLSQVYLLTDFFPTELFYFGGISVMGPREVISLRRYNPVTCILASYNHRQEHFMKYSGSTTLNCGELATIFPFRNNQNILYNGHATMILENYKGNDDDYNAASQTWNISATMRDTWQSLSEASGQQLTDSIANLNAVQINNNFSTCSAHANMTVVEFNAERGRQLMSAIKIIETLNADVIILNEMDIGMARSDQQHTASLLASSLGMNYAWGLEFIELTRGTKKEQQDTNGLYNFLGLHGNAILSKCKIEDPIIFRENIGDYFSDQNTSINANGYEKRLGGRMVMLARIRDPRNNTIVVGSTHKWGGDEAGVKAYIDDSQAVITGDQDWSFCDRVGLVHVDSRDHATWPASCETPGTARGDIICSNMKVALSEATKLPCVVEFGNKIQLSDPALTTVSLYHSEKA